MLRRLAPLIAFCFALAPAASAHAATFADPQDCGLYTSCGLHRTLHLLYGAVTFLTIVLVIVLAAAAYVYRKNKRSEPHNQ